MSAKLKHIGFIMDGNGRWANAKGMPREKGHKAGLDVLKKVVDYCFANSVEIVSLYAFSTENWSRPQAEIKQIFDLLRVYIKSNLKYMQKEGIRLSIMGDVSALPTDLQKSIAKALDETKNNTHAVLNIGINYGSRPEIIRAVNACLAAGKKSITEEEFSGLLYTKGLKDPDLIIRTSGEQRLSNFMLYQSAYSEFYFTKVLWPDFSIDELQKAFDEYNSRLRRFGGIKA